MSFEAYKLKMQPCVKILEAIVTARTETLVMTVEGPQTDIEVHSFQFAVGDQPELLLIEEIFGRYQLQCPKCLIVFSPKEIEDWKPCPRCKFEKPVFEIINDNRCILEIAFKNTKPFLRAHLRRIPLGIVTNIPLESRDLHFTGIPKIKVEEGMTFTLKWPLHPPKIEKDTKIKIALMCRAPL